MKEFGSGQQAARERPRSFVIGRAGPCWLVALFVCQFGCATKTTPLQREVFRQEIAPVLGRFCIRCHGIEEREAGLDLRTLPKLLRGGHSGPAIIWGQPNKSLLLKMVTDEKMPPEGAKPNAGEIATLTRWIEYGGPSRAPQASPRRD